MPQSRYKVKKEKGSSKIKGNRNAKSLSTTSTIVDPSLLTRSAVLDGLPREEADFLTRHVCFSFRSPSFTDCSSRSFKEGPSKVEVTTFVSQVVDALQQFHMCVLYDALSDQDIENIMSEYEDLLDVKHGAHAIGEKDASKRSGTRMWNCPCQLGPNCSFQGWRDGSEETRLALQKRRTSDQGSRRKTHMWQEVCNEFGFTHIARVEVVTSHVGCRNQDWHCDSAHGITVIFALVDIDLAKGPTEIEFITPFNCLGHDANSGKIKQKHRLAPPSVHAVMPKGSVLMFNANANHRGTANLSSSDRPILVLDTSPPCEHLDGSCWEQNSLS
mmetsp:Transcript_2865/g.5179  ORF Transcript_2865/g.5179 Transcript_2865/m.5179 type:complete len:329 (+) Transcript_2865:175-1161(+)|eukprot:CAMPEP_0114418354 /NCGR_PEP_ID=MMETSP0103-20121206/3450_1 /TAXON_ID=37642 ORGANISM="Paraphysomonas imperforata, Strain PA2" /NCGR_SAMPLE_ID=MMETSP0103 /ASSEMBLY_ACC=CAM_ASM_000201 /LENGTH=328 /DNA_ID=CAMNT_0001586703 /DNA_START=215 /DNA_END=1201 /DNA_ORIENTATION=+